MPGKGEMTVEILEDGSLKIETGDMAGAAHKSADEFLKEVLALCGGDEARTPLKKHHHHHGEHEHAHEGGGHHHHH